MSLAAITEPIFPGLTAVSDLDIAIEDRGIVHSICALKSRRNVASSRIFRIPDEILEEILYISTPENRRSNGNLVLGQVCAFWRKVALGSPRLWSRVVVDGRTNTLLLEELMRRSGSYPLDMELYNFCKLQNGVASYDETTMLRLREVLPLGVAALTRTGHLHVVFAYIFWHQTQSSYTKLPPPSLSQLRTLRFTVPGAAAIESQLSFLSHPDGLPALQRMTTDCGYSKIFPYLYSTSPTVTHYHMRVIGPRLGLPPSPTWGRELLSALRQMPNLVTLNLCACHYILPEKDVAVRLPQLKTMRLRASPKELGWLLDHLDVPPSSRIHMTLYLSDKNCNELPEFGGIVSSVLRSRTTNSSHSQSCHASFHRMPAGHFDEDAHELNLWGYETHDGTIPITEVTMPLGLTIAVCQEDLLKRSSELNMLWSALPLDEMPLELGPVNL